jgi:protocatechuate 3,4-dioxygenase beta subunit
MRWSLTTFLPRVLTLALICTPLASVASSSPRAPVIGGPCEGCELVFEGMPEELSARARIAPPGEPGEPLRIEGRVVTQQGVPVPGVIVYAYHTDENGVYPQAATRHGRLRGWARTDADGRYVFETIRPASYPDSRVPQHVHMHVIEPSRATYYIDSIVFADDPLLDAEARERDETARGGNGLVRPERDGEGVWHVRRDIQLGEDVPGYADVEPRSGGVQSPSGS